MENSSCIEEPPSNARKGGTSPRQPVKSTAIVKYSAVNSPVHFERLKFNTDLNLPPSNWLKSSTESYGLHHILTHSSGFSSFRIAHMFPDCVGEVDVVSDAENIKKLLKIPYSRGTVSMMVHRVENTLLIDEFDIHKHLLRQAESDWEWLRKFFLEHVFHSLSEKDKALLSYRNNTRYALQQKSLVSKFLHYSLAEPQQNQEGVNKFSSPMPLRTCEHPLPEPRFEEGLPDSAHDHKFTRNVVWTFEDIQMLLGTDMPIFGGSTHPCISLRLRDVAKPISVLTGIDYWLDNLMSNVPEVVMCYHLDGIVQKYELIKTEDLPHLPDAKFSPKLIRDVAQNILSFLKSNATKAGHTYWLFKGRDDDVVKLYDLSSLCSDTLVDKGQNPFTVPVGMLLYRVARNMKQSASGSNTQPGTIRMLLKNALSLLPKEKYPQIVTSAHYMLSDLYVPLDTDPLSPELLDEPLAEESAEDEEEEESMMSNSVPVTDLCISMRQSLQDNKYIHPPPLVGTIEERCKMSLYHVSEGLECLQYFDSTDNSNGREKQTQEEEPQMAKPFQAIPMPYGKINSNDSNISNTENQKDGFSRSKEGKSKRKKKSEGKTGRKESAHQSESSEVIGDDSSLKALLCKSQGEAMPTWHQPDKMDSASWKNHLQHLLLMKARLVYTTLAEQHYQANRFGLSLKYLSGVLNCSEDGRMLVSLMLERAGDCCLRIAKDWDNVETHRADLSFNESIIKLSDKILECFADSCADIPIEIESIEQLLLSSLHCYEKAAKYHPNDGLTRKLGNAHNELGSMYMNQAAAMFQNSQKCIGTEEFQILLKDSEKHLFKSLKSFECVSDNANIALIHSNTGRLMRLKAHCNFSSAHLSNSQRDFYNKAQNSYLAALSVLKSRKVNPMVWDSVTWELSTTLFTIATLTQDHPFFINKSQEEIEREVADLLLKALKYCDLETPGPRLPVYQFRAAKIHHRLASLYHNSYREQSGDDAKRKNLLQLCQMHYTKASKLLFHLEHPSDLLTVQLERVSLAEFISELATSNNQKLKSLQSALDIIYECRPILVIIEESNKVLLSNISKGNNKIDDMEMAERKEEEKLTLLLEQRFQFLLRTIIKLLLTGSSQKNNLTTPCEKVVLVSQYKEVYSHLLKKGDAPDLVTHLISVIDHMKNLKKV